MNTPTEPTNVPLADICKRLKIEPYDARVKLRAAYKNGDDKAKLPKHKKGQAWEFAPSEVKAIEAVLKA
jgi:hypothetical protein